MQDASPIHGFVAKVDPSNSNERELFRGHERVGYIQIKYSDSHWLLDEDNHVEDLVGPDQKLILVDWEDGEKLIGREPDDIVRRCLKLEEHLDYVYLGDRWTYETSSPRKNRNQIKRSVGLQRELGERFKQSDVDFEFNPMVLGWKTWHLERQRDLIEDFGNDLVGFDATGYNSKNTCSIDVNNAIDTLGLEGVYVSGRGGPTYLELFPSEVKAFSAKAELINEVRVGDEEYSRNLLSQSIERRVKAFNDPQTDLRQFNTATS